MSQRQVMVFAVLTIVLLGALPAAGQSVGAGSPGPANGDTTFQLFDQALNFMPALYAGVRGLIASLLTHTLLKEQPQLSGIYAEAITFLTSITAVYVILEFFSLARKIVLVLLATGWGLFLVTLVVRST